MIAQLQETDKTNVFLTLAGYLKETVLERARTDCKYFMDYVFEYTSVQMHNDWQDFISGNKYGEILAPRDHGKTEQITIGRACWEIGKNPNMRIKLATESEDLAMKIMSRISATLIKNKRYKEVFPIIMPSDIGSWTKYHLTVDRQEDHKDPSIEAAGIMTSSTGGRADLIIFDDITGYRNTIQFPRMRKQVKEAVYNNWLNMLHGPKARWYLVGTPWHVDDVIWEIKNNDAVPKAPVHVVDVNFNSPWPENCPPEYLKEKLRIIKQKAYNRGYRLVPMSEDEAWINPSNVDGIRDFELKVNTVRDNKNIVKYTGVDLGHREGPEAAPTVVYTIGRTPNGKRIPCDIRISHESSPLQIGRVIIDVYKTLKPAKIMVENVGAQKYLVDLLKSMGPKGLPIEGYFTGNQKMSLETGVPSLLAEIEGGQWVVALGSGGDHDITCRCNYCIWMQEVKNFPLGSCDTLMASWFALEGLRKVAERGTHMGNFSVWNW